MSDPSHGTHDLLLVGLSVLIAVVASYVALEFAGLAHRAGPRNRCAWPAAALTMGGGIWAMHFVGMLGFRVPAGGLSYDVGLTALSLTLAVLGTGAAFLVISQSRTLLALVGSGPCAAAGFRSPAPSNAQRGRRIPCC